MLSNKLATELLARFNKIKGDRASIETTLQQIADYVLVHKGDFTNGTTPPSTPQIKTTKVYDNTAIEANNRLASTIHGGLTNSGSKWFALKFKGTIPQSIESQRWLDDANQKMLDIFNSSFSGFSSQNHEFLLSVCSLGTACMFIEDAMEEGIRFSTVHMSEVFVLEDSYGQIDTVFRKFTYTYRQAAQHWGLEVLPMAAQKRFQKNPDGVMNILHCVRPAGMDAESPNQYFKFDSIYVDMDSSEVLSYKGFFEIPYVVARFSKRTGEIYGRSPAWDSLPAIKMINQMSKEYLRSVQLRNAPPLLVADDGVLGATLAVSPNQIIMGGISYDGSGARVEPLNVGNQPDGMMQAILRTEQTIRETFFVDQLYFKEGTPVTATEAVQRQEARLQMLSPAVSRLEKEYLNQLIETVFNILLRRGDITAPDESINVNEIEIEYLSPLAKLQKMQDVQALQRAFGALAPMAQLDPQMFDVIDLSEATKYACLAAGVPASLLRSEQELEQINKQKQAQQMAAQNMQLAAYANNINQPLQ